jgi:hypothetical protein
MTDTVVKTAEAAPGTSTVAPTGSRLASEPLRNLLDHVALDAIETLRSRGHDPARAPKFWEDFVASEVGGETTAHRCPWDVHVDIEGFPLTIEVKFSQEVLMRKARTRDRVPVFEWALPQGVGKVVM